MSFKSFIAAVALLLSATTISFAQSSPNCGPNAPGTGDTFGKPVSGTLEGQRGAERCRTRNFHKRVHNRRHRHVYSSR
jgi:hypothetical protein